MFRNWIFDFGRLLAFIALIGYSNAAEIEAEKIAVIHLSGAIGPMVEMFVSRKLVAAEASGADLIVLEIDSPGGRIDVMDKMIEQIKNSSTKVVAYVPRQALSAAAILSLACQEIIVEPDALFGDAGPIFMDEGFMFQHAPEKIRSHLAEQVRDLAIERGRPPALAEAMVDMNLEVYQYRNKKDGRVSFMSQNELQSIEKADDWEEMNLVHESRKDHFLEVAGRRAVELGLADAVIQNRDALKKRYDATEIIEFEPTGMDTAVFVFNHPIVTGLLFIVGLIALYVEFATPGIGVGGLTAIVCFSLFFWSRFLGGTAEWLEVILFVSGIVLLLVELFVLPGFGIWGLSGLFLMGASLVMASQDFLIPHNDQQWSLMLNSLSVIIGSMVIFAVIAGILTSKMGSLPVFNRLLLNPPDVVENIDEVFADAVGVQVGDTGISDSLLRPAGKARFGDEYIDVISDGVLIDPGSPIRVVRILGNTIFVRAI